MQNQMSKTKQILFIIAIMLTSIPVIADAVIIPISHNLYQIFPENTGAVNFIVSGPQLLLAIGSLLAAPAMMKISKKTILVVSGILCALCLCFGVAIENVWYVLICRSVAGFTAGFINVVGLAMLAEIFTDDKKRGNLMGFYNAFQAAAATLLANLAGRLAVSHWTYSYKAFYICIPMALGFIFFIPKMKASLQEVTGEQKETGTKKGFGLPFWMLMISLFLFYIANMGIAYFVSVYVAENGLGNEAFAGTVASLSTVGSFFFCLAFGFLYNKLKGKLGLVLYVLFALCTLLLIVAPGKAVLIVVTLVAGGLYGAAYSYSFAHAPALVNPSQSDTAISIATFDGAIGSFVATYVVTFFMGLKGGSFTAILPYMLIIAVVAVVVEIINVAISRKQG